MPSRKILVTGAQGQIGTELVVALRNKFGRENVVASGQQDLPSESRGEWEPFVPLDITDKAAMAECFEEGRFDVVYHLAAMLSAVGEQNPEAAWNVNLNGLHDVLEAARQHGVQQVFWPSSIAVFGPDTPKEQTPQETLMRPTTMYGVTKVAGELLCDYYVEHYGLDVRGLRYPGVISSEALPGGGTTDYAVAIFYEALRSGRYTCFVREDTVLPMIYMPDCIAAAIQLMDADNSRLEHHNAFNLAAMSFSAGELAAEIRKHIPNFQCEFVPDERQQYADSWPRSIDDSAARREWDWKPEYDLARMTADMLERLGKRMAAGTL
jgi:nucleoside-diphosphate-sugar epimerase